MWRVPTRLAALALLAAPAARGETPATPTQRLRADISALVAFGTRHTLSSETDPHRGIGAARRWAEQRFREIGAACHGCLEIALPESSVTGERIHEPAHIVDIVAVQRGSERPREVVIVQAHIDSRVSDVMDAGHDAPGADDDGSGTALVLEAARVLSQRHFPATIVYAVLSGEEQGLYGGKLLADYAKAQGWVVKAVLNNDIVGSTRSSDGAVDANYVRVFSEGPRADADDKSRAALRREGGENDSPSRNLSRYIARIAGRDPRGLAVRQVWRADRMGRGGDHLPFQALGYPAIRVTEAVENYDHQHQDLRQDHGVVYGDRPEFMDFSYLAKVTRFNIAALDALAHAPMPPETRLEAAVSNDSVLHWQPVEGAAGYRIYRRVTDASDWGPPVATVMRPAATSAGGLTFRMPGIRGDDWFFGVSSLASSEGAESPIASAVPGGQFAPLSH